MLKALFLCPYDHIYPPMNGGMQRCFHLLHQLSKYFEVTAIIKQDKTRFGDSFGEFPALRKVNLVSYASMEHQQPKDLFSILPGRVGDPLRYRWYKRTLRGTTDSNLVNYYPLLKDSLLAEQFDIVILENLDTLNAVDVIRRYNKKATVIYDTHNVGTELVISEMQKWKVPDENMQAVKFAESHLFQTVDAIFTCSDRELKAFIALNPGPLAGAVIPNGVHLPPQLHAAGVLLDQPTHIIFCGSLGYEPNSEGLEWFYNSAWRTIRAKNPGLQLIIAGSGSLPLKMRYMEDDDSLVFTGTVQDLKPWYNMAAVAVVPLKSGSGTRLKILEAMGLGVPVVSTSKGAEGLEFSDHSEILIADDEISIATSTLYLLENKKQRLDIQAAARKRMESEYDWNIIGKKMEAYLEGSLPVLRDASNYQKKNQ